MLIACFDDAEAHGDARIVAWGGLIGTEAQWAELDVAWRKLLKEPLPAKPALNKFDVTRCRRHEGDFQDYSEVESDHLTDLFRTTIIDSKLCGIASAVCRTNFDELIVGKYRDRLGDAETSCFLSCIERGLACARRAYPNEREISMMFDLERRGPLEALVSRVLAVKDRESPQIVNISFSPVEEFPPLQAADTVAAETHNAADRWLTDAGEARPHFHRYLDNLATEGFIADRQEILKTIAHLALAGIEP
jgi:hypothetical protein